jgi:hypothetical protein
MGMDVIAKAAVSESAESFRNNVWWWRPLAQYITECAPDRIVSKCTYWQSNDGDGLNAEDSRKLADFLEAEVANGNCAAWAAEREARLSNLPLLSCQWCGGTGTRRDAVGVQAGMDKKNWCNGCDGTGTKPHSDTDYRFSVENVSEFVAFLRDCGGFEIW